MTGIRHVDSLRLLVFSVFIVSLIGSVTNLVPLSVVYVSLIFLSPLLLVKYDQLHNVSVATLLLLSYFLLSVLAYKPRSLLEPLLYRWDGNVFVTFFPLVFLPLFRFKVDSSKIAELFLYWASFVNFLVFCLYLATGNAILTFYDFNDKKLYHFLFQAHNAAGGVLALLSCLSIAFVIKKKNFLSVFILLLNLLTLWLSDSRGSVLGLLAGLFIVFVMKEKKLKALFLSIAFLHIVMQSITYPMWLEAGKPADMADMADIGGIDALNRSGTIVDRVLKLWPRATHLFVHSPIFGTGFGSFNDGPYDFQGIEHFFMLNRADVTRFNAGHAHHSFFHVLAETGLVGLFLLLLVLFYMHKSIREMKSDFLRQALSLAFWMNIFSSMTEHRLFTPAQMIPFVILYCFSLRYQQTGTEIRSVKVRSVSQNGVS